MGQIDTAGDKDVYVIDFQTQQCCNTAFLSNASNLSPNIELYYEECDPSTPGDCTGVAATLWHLHQMLSTSLVDCTTTQHQHITPSRGQHTLKLQTA